MGGDIENVATGCGYTEGMRVHPLLFSSAALAIMLFAASAVHADPSVDKLFFIQHSKDANEVHYDARLNADGTLDSKDPVDGYWLKKASGGGRAAITTFQKISYGWVVEAAGTTYIMKLKAHPDRPLTLIRVTGHWRARTTIAGKQAYLKRLYVATDESGVTPKVLYIDFLGEDASSGAAVQDHIVKN